VAVGIVIGIGADITVCCGYIIGIGAGAVCIIIGPAVEKTTGWTRPPDPAMG
jgi:hypothetical protein